MDDFIPQGTSNNVQNLLWLWHIEASMNVKDAVSIPQCTGQTLTSNNDLVQNVNCANSGELWIKEHLYFEYLLLSSIFSLKCCNTLHFLPDNSEITPSSEALSPKLTNIFSTGVWYETDSVLLSQVIYWIRTKLCVCGHNFDFPVIITYPYITCHFFYSK